jgi:hypothetical protein
VRPILEASEQSLGKPPTGGGIQAYAPPILEASRMLSQAPAKSWVGEPAVPRCDAAATVAASLGLRSGFRAAAAPG